MTRRKLNRIRHKYNVVRRIRRGWTPPHFANAIDAQADWAQGDPDAFTYLVRQFARFYGVL